MSSLPKNAVLGTFYGSHQASPWRDQGEMSILLKRIWVWASEEAHKAQTWRQEITRQSRLCEFFIKLVRYLDDFTILGFQEIQNLVDRNSGLKICSMTPHSYLATRGRACSLKLSYCNQIKYQIGSIDSSSYLLGIECYLKWSELFPEDFYDDWKWTRNHPKPIWIFLFQSNLQSELAGWSLPIHTFHQGDNLIPILFHWGEHLKEVE